MKLKHLIFLVFRVIDTIRKEEGKMAVKELSQYPPDKWIRALNRKYPNLWIDLRKQYEDPSRLFNNNLKLESFLKLANAVESGGMAKNFILNEEVTVNGEVCTMRGKKLRPGDVVGFDGSKYLVTQENP